MWIGFTLYTLVPMNVAAKRITLIQNCHIFSLGAEKFSLLHSNRVAAASRPTTAGRRPLKTDCTAGVFMYLMNILAMIIIRMSDGSTRANVATQEPRIDIDVPSPALWQAI